MLSLKNCTRIKKPQEVGKNVCLNHRKLTTHSVGSTAKNNQIFNNNF